MDIQICGNVSSFERSQVWRDEHPSLLQTKDEAGVTQVRRSESQLKESDKRPNLLHTGEIGAVAGEAGGHRSAALWESTRRFIALKWKTL